MADGSRDVFTSSIKINPSKQASVCTHLQEFSSDLDKSVRDECKTKSDEAVCKTNKKCQWTPAYGIKFEKSGCSDSKQHQIGQALSDKVYTPSTCDQACISDEYCVEFAVGREFDANHGKCFLYKGACTKSADGTFDLYKTS